MRFRALRAYRYPMQAKGVLANRVLRTSRLLAFLLLLPATGWAQNGAPLEEGKFSVDLYQGPVLGSSRVIGLGGAYAAMAEEAVGIQFNPAAVANRTWYSKGRWDWDLTVDWLIPNVAQSDGFSLDNSGLTAEIDSFAVINIGGLLQYKNFGVGLYVQLQTFDRQLAPLSAGAPNRQVKFDFTTLHLSFGYAFFDHQLVAALGLRGGSLSAKEQPVNRTLIDLDAIGLEAGVLFRPRRLPVRFGAAFYSALSESKREATVPFPDLATPQTVSLPWQVTLGAAWQVFGPTLNPAPNFGPPPKPTSASKVPSTTRPKSPTAEPTTVATKPGPTSRGVPYLLFTFDVQVAAPVENAVGITSYLSGIREDSGTSYAVSIRAGLEAEVWPRRLRLRAGTYFEPSRFEATSGRTHGTVGFDIRLFDWGPYSFRAGLVGDFARNYSNLGISLGLWR